MLPLLDDARGQWAHLPAGLIAHLERVSEGARALAARWDVDPERAALGGFLHDVARAQPPPTLLRQARDLGLPIGPVEEAVPLLLHGPVGAGRLRTQLNVIDEAVVEAVYWHTTGLATMGPIAKAVFLADKFDLAKASRYPHIGRVKEFAADDMDRAIVEFLRGDIVRLLNEGVPVHPGSQETLDGLLLAMGGR